MAQVISTRPETKTTQYGRKSNAPKRPPLFRKFNYILMAVGAVLLLVGYIVLSGGASNDPAQFSEAIFDTRRLVVAPILILLGLVTEIFAIMWHPRKKETAETSSETKEL